MSSFIPLQQWGKEGESTFPCISFTVLCSFLLESVQTALQVIFWHQGLCLNCSRQTGALHGFQGRVRMLAPPWYAQWWGLAAPFSPSAFVSRKGSWHAVFTKDMFAVLFWCTFVNYPGGRMLGKSGSIPGDGIKANQREKQQYGSLPYHHWRITSSPLSSRELSSKSAWATLKEGLLSLESSSIFSYQK